MAGFVRGELDTDVWVRHVHLGVRLTATASLIGLAYAVLTPDGDGRPAMAGLFLSALLVALVIDRLPLTRLVSSPWAPPASYVWTLANLGVVAVAAALDGGAASPVTFLLFLPLAYAGIVYQPFAVGAFGGLVLAAYLATGLVAAVVDSGHLLLFSAALVLSTLLCVVAARNHWRHAETLQRLSERLASLAHEDPLTGVLNHRAFHDRLRAESERATRHGRPLTLMQVDLDDFKVVNDVHGHPAGDQVLRNVALALQQCTRESDACGRLGGDEFAVLLPETDAEGALTVAARLRRCLAALDDPVAVTVSVGVATLPTHAYDPKTLCETADEAVYLAKRAGRDCARAYSADVQAAPPVDGIDVVLQRRVKEVLATRGLHSVFQPIVDLRDGRVLGYEALARIEGSGLGPDRWLDMAEQVGLRGQLEELMWEAALAAGPPPGDAMLFLNASPGALAGGQLLQRLQGVVAPVAIEVSEQHHVRDYAVLTRSLGEWADAGVQVAVDDMGAGYANMRHVVNLAPQFLKLDRSIVANLDSSPRRQALVDSMLEFASQIGSEIIAEGVEHPCEVAALRRAGVRYAQGYLLAHPGPPWPAVAWHPSRPAASREAGPA